LLVDLFEPYDDARTCERQIYFSITLSTPTSYKRSCPSGFPTKPL